MPNEYFNNFNEIMLSVGTYVYKTNYMETSVYV